MLGSSGSPVSRGPYVMLPGIRLVMVAALATAVLVMIALGVAGSFRIVRDTPISLVTSQTTMVEPALPRHLGDQQLPVAIPPPSPKGPATRADPHESTDAGTAGSVRDPQQVPVQTTETGPSSTRRSDEPDIAAPAVSAGIHLDLKPNNARTADQGAAEPGASPPDPTSAKLDLPASPTGSLPGPEPVSVDGDNSTSPDDGPRTGAIDKGNSPIPVVAATTSGQRRHTAFLPRSHSHSSQRLRTRASRPPARSLPTVAAPEGEALFKRID
jgi:hypothetical protein